MNSTWMKRMAAMALIGAAGFLASCAQMKSQESGQQVRLDGSHEVPPVTTSAYGTGTVNIMAGRSVMVTVSVIGMTPTDAHIHEGAADSNGPVIVPVTRISGNAFVAPDAARLTEAQYASYMAGKLYVNLHSAKFPGGEVRAQIVGR